MELDANIKTEAIESDSNSEFDHNLPPIVIPLDRVQVESDPEDDKPNTSNLCDLFDCIPSTSSVTANHPANHSDLDLIIQSHRCPICKVSFTSLFRVCSHILKHYNIQLYSCTHCDQRFAYSSLLRHQRKVHAATSKAIKTAGGNDPEVQQKRCYKKFIKEEHIQCPFCKIQFLTIPQMAKHLIRTHRHQVLIAQSDSKSKKEKTPVRVAPSETFIQSSLRRKCDFSDCQEQFSSKQLLIGHKKHAHGHELASMKFVCGFDNCNMEFSRALTLQYHKLWVHGRRNIQTHRVCRTFDRDSVAQLSPEQLSKTLVRQDNLPLSIETESKLVCSICESEEAFQCNRITELSGHLINSHSDLITERSNTAKWNACPFCDNFFPKRTTFARHILEHFKMLPFKCEICETRFYTQEQLAGHKFTSDKFRVRLKAAEEKVTEFLREGVECKFRCPVKDECLVHASPCKTEQSDKQHKCGPIRTISQKYNFSVIPMRINDRFAQVKFYFILGKATESTRRDPHKSMNIRIELMACPLCETSLTFTALRNHLHPQQRALCDTVVKAKQARSSQLRTVPFKFHLRPAVKSAESQCVAGPSRPPSLAMPFPVQQKRFKKVIVKQSSVLNHFQRHSNSDRSHAQSRIIRVPQPIIGVPQPIIGVPQPIIGVPQPRVESPRSLSVQSSSQQPPASASGSLSQTKIVAPASPFRKVGTKSEREPSHPKPVKSKLQFVRSFNQPVPVQPRAMSARKQRTIRLVDKSLYQIAWAGRASGFMSTNPHDCLVPNATPTQTHNQTSNRRTQKVIMVPDLTAGGKLVYRRKN